MARKQDDLASELDRLHAQIPMAYLGPVTKKAPLFFQENIMYFGLRLPIINHLECQDFFCWLSSRCVSPERLYVKH
jgi:hypothetical protein